MLYFYDMQCILIVEDRESVAEMLRATLESGGFRAVTARDATQAIKKLREEKIDLVLTDLRLPGKSGIEVLRASRDEESLRPVIVMTAYGSVENAVSAMKQGAYDFITKPFDTEHLLMLIRRALENQRLLAENILLREEISSRFLPPIVGKSPAMADLAEKIRRVAPAKSTVLLLGESGTGKELFARAIHWLSPRRDHPFVAINCAAIPKDLIETELFGYEKGAFTGAEKTKPGKLELADMGTVFLDEVGELDFSLQAKLLRALQENEIERVGGTRPIRIDARIVAASNRDIERAVAEKAFREDLFYRLNVFPLRIPPLRERKGDIPLLAEYFLSKYSAELKSGQKKLSAEAVEALAGYFWKGNVRELENAMERAVILSDGEWIRAKHLNLPPVAEEGVSSAQPAASLEEASRRASRAAESEMIKRSLAASGGNKTRTAEALKVSYKTLLTKIKEYGLEE
jgi:DNA-binding NtrC family response regulator